MGEARRRKLWLERREKMADLKIIGPDGKEIQPPSKENPVVPSMPGAVVIAQIETFPGKVPGTSQFGIKALSPISVLDLCKVLAQLISALIEKNQKETSRIISPGGQ